MSVASIGYLRISASDVDAWMHFGSDTLGLMVAEREDAHGARFLRMDDHPFRFMIEPGTEDKLLAAAFAFRSADEWQHAIDRLQAASVEVVHGSADEAARRCVTAFVTVQDPCGNPIELYHGRQLDYQPFVSPVGISHFVTGDAATNDFGFGHVVLPAPDTEAAVSFYCDLLGFGICDNLHLPPPAEGAPPMLITFMHADNPRQHSLALFNGPVPGGVVHMMVEVPTLDQVGHAMDRAKRNGHHIVTSLGRHINDNMCSFYVAAPGGIPVEYGYDGLLVDDWSTYTPTVSTEGDLWGHEYHFPALED